MENDLSLVKLHDNKQYLDQCCDLLNDYWPRSRAARLHSLNRSNDSYPCNYVLIELKTDKVIGHVSCSNQLTFNNLKTAYVESLIVHKKFRRKGLGRFIMNELEKKLAQDQFKVISLRTFDQVVFYESIGFEKINFIKSTCLIGQNKKRFLNQLNEAQINRKSENDLKCVKTNDEQLNRSAPPVPPPLPSTTHQTNYIKEYIMEKLIIN